MNSHRQRIPIAFVLFSIGIVTIAGGCGPEDAALEEQAIISGSVATASDEVSASTVAVVINEAWLAQEKKTCSGTLIGKRVVLTAEHCFAAGPECKILFALDVHDPNAVSIPCKAMRGAAGDIALAYLEQDAPSGYTPVPYLTMQDELPVGEPIILAGYGKTHVDAYDSRGVLRFRSQQVSRFYPEGKTFRYDGAGGCNGDSGGPAFVRNPEGGLSLAGVHIAGDLYCREFGLNTDVRYYTDWIETAIKEASSEATIDCSQDLPPADSPYTCAEQAQWNKCGESWMQGFCNIACGRCQ